jgi:hypothetical protein
MEENGGREHLEINNEKQNEIQEKPQQKRYRF